MLGQDVGQMHSLVRSPLRRHHDAANLLHLGVVRWAHSVQVARDLERRHQRSL